MEGVGLMSEENVELTRAAIDAFNRDDLAWMLGRVDDDFEFDWSRSRGPLSGVYRGRDGVTEFIREQWSTSDEEFRIEPREFIDRVRHVVVPNGVRARGRGGIDVTASLTHLFPVEDGRPVSGRREWRCTWSARKHLRQPPSDRGAGVDGACISAGSTARVFFGDQEGSERSWLPVERELGIAHAEGEGARWAVVFLDSEGVP